MLVHYWYCTNVIIKNFFGVKTKLDVLQACHCRWQNPSRSPDPSDPSDLSDPSHPSDSSDPSGTISHPSHGSTFRKKLQPGCNLCKSNRVEARHASCQSIFASSAACWGSSILRTPAVSAPPSESPQRG